MGNNNLCLAVFMVIQTTWYGVWATKQTFTESLLKPTTGQVGIGASNYVAKREEEGKQWY